MSINAQQVALDTLANGGASVYADGSVPVSGYMVGGVTSPIVIPNREVSTDRVRRAVELLARCMDTTGSHALGTWVDQRGSVFVELSANEPDRDTAILLARDRGEEAIYDVAAAESIYV